MSGRLYERVTCRGHDGKRQVLLLRILNDGPEFLLGQLVDREGADVGKLSGEGGRDVTLTQHLIQHDTILRREPLTISNHYGTLEPDNTRSAP